MEGMEDGKTIVSALVLVGKDTGNLLNSCQRSTLPSSIQPQNEDTLKATVP